MVPERISAIYGNDKYFSVHKKKHAERVKQLTSSVSEKVEQLGFKICPQGTQVGK
jgi:hypothetical protein